MPGFGHIDFEQIIATLKGMSYSGTTSFEPNISTVDYQKELFFGKKFLETIEIKISIVGFIDWIYIILYLSLNIVFIILIP